MSNKSDTAIIHSWYINSDHTLQTQGKQRGDRGFELLNSGKVKTLTMSGGYATKGVDCTQSEAMRRYLVNAGVDEKFLYSETFSLDTVGEAIFTKLAVILPEHMSDITVVSSQYHLRRLKYIYDCVYGENFNITYEGVPSDLDNNPDTLQLEQKSLSAFYKTFQGITPGNDTQILKRLFSDHPLYNQNSELKSKLEEKLNIII